MKFGEIDVGDAGGTVLAHALSAGARRLRKGHQLESGDLAELVAAGVMRVIVARLEVGDLGEDAAAQVIADAIAPDHLRFSPASTGRVNIFATVNGHFRANKSVVDELNRIDPAITLACLADHVDVREGDMVATIKIIPLAVDGSKVGEAAALLEGRAPFEVKPFVAHKVGLIATVLPTLKPSVMDKTRQLLEERLAASGSVVADEVRIEHGTEALAEALLQAVSRHQMVVVFGASAVTDADDVIPAAIRQAGGMVEQVGLPVDPGNLLVLGRIGDVPVIGAPGCARSPRENGFDWILSRLLAGEKPTSEDMTGLGVGGLLMEIPTRPRPRLAPKVLNEELRVAAVILAAGQARRMGASGKHKLLARFDGVPLVRRSVEVVLASDAQSCAVVTGHRADDIEAALSGLDVDIVRNPDYATGMATSLRAGLAHLREQADGLMVVLADMPAVTSADLDRMIAAFRKEEGRAIIRAVSSGKRGNPVILPAATFEAVARLEGDIGARPIIEESGLIIVDVEIGAAAHLDADTPEAVIAAGGVLAD